MIRKKTFTLLVCLTIILVSFMIWLVPLLTRPSEIITPDSPSTLPIPNIISNDIGKEEAPTIVASPDVVPETSTNNTAETITLSPEEDNSTTNQTKVNKKPIDYSTAVIDDLSSAIMDPEYIRYLYPNLPNYNFINYFEASTGLSFNFPDTFTLYEASQNNIYAYDDNTNIFVCYKSSLNTDNLSAIVRAISPILNKRLFVTSDVIYETLNYQSLDIKDTTYILGPITEEISEMTFYDENSREELILPAYNYFSYTTDKTAFMVSVSSKSLTEVQLISLAKAVCLSLDNNYKTTIRITGEKETYSNILKSISFEYPAEWKSSTLGGATIFSAPDDSQNPFRGCQIFYYEDNGKILIPDYSNAPKCLAVTLANSYLANPVSVDIISANSVIDQKEKTTILGTSAIKYTLSTKIFLATGNAPEYLPEENPVKSVMYGVRFGQTDYILNFRYSKSNEEAMIHLADNVINSIKKLK